MGKGCENRKGKIAGYGNLVLSWLKIYLRWLKENGSLVYTAFVVTLRVSKESKACQMLPIITFVCCLSFLVLLFSLFSSLGKRNQITEVRSHVHYDHELICTDSCLVDRFDLFCFCLDGPVWPGRSFGLSIC